MEDGREATAQTGQDRFSIPHIEIFFARKFRPRGLAYYLKDKGSPYQPEALVFETGTNKWVSYDFLAASSKCHCKESLFQRTQSAFI